MDGRGRQALGKKGEDEACAYLESVGHRILERNWRSGRMEIDIISESRDGIHFVEVKSVVAPAGFDPAEKVGAAKRRRITAAALGYLNAGKRRGPGPGEVFFDVVTVVFDGGERTLNYVPQAWIPMYF